MPARRILDRYPNAIEWTEAVTVIGHGIALDGQLKARDCVIVGGRLDGGVTCDKLVRVLPGGLVRGPVEAEAVLVEGAVDGDILVRSQFELARTGRVRGDVEGPRISVSEGAYLKGRLRSTAGRIHRFRERRS